MSFSPRQFIFTRSTAPSGATGGAGSWTWTLPPQFAYCELILIGGGGGGASGRKQTSPTTYSAGNKKGNPGGYTFFRIATVASRTLTINVGAGGTGAAGSSIAAEPVYGGDGTATTVTDGVTTMTAGPGGTYGTSPSYSRTATGTIRIGINATVITGQAFASDFHTGPLFGGDGAILQNSTVTASLNGGTPPLPVSSSMSAGGGDGVNGAAGLNCLVWPFFGGGGGGGGASITSANGGNGGNGGLYGGGGGGGGDQTNASGSSGSGGNGGDGVVVITVYS